MAILFAFSVSRVFSHDTVVAIAVRKLGWIIEVTLLIFLTFSHKSCQIQ